MWLAQPGFRQPEVAISATYSSELIPQEGAPEECPGKVFPPFKKFFHLKTTGQARGLGRGEPGQGLKRPISMSEGYGNCLLCHLWSPCWAVGVPQVPPDPPHSPRLPESGTTGGIAGTCGLQWWGGCLWCGVPGLTAEQKGSN